MSAWYIIGSTAVEINNALVSFAIVIKIMCITQTTARAAKVFRSLKRIYIISISSEKTIMG